MLSPITIQICTYNRPSELVQMIEALGERLNYPRHLVEWLICDDSSDTPYAERIAQIYAGRGLKMKAISTGTRGGWGKNVNNGLRLIRTPYVFFCEDDYIAIEAVHLDLAVALLEREQQIGLVRLDGIAGHKVTAELKETDVSPVLVGYSHTEVKGLMPYWLLLPESKEGYLYSNRPHVKRTNFHRYYGLYPEGKKLGETETGFAISLKNRLTEPNAPQIACLFDGVSRKWQHIGESFQLSKQDIGE